MWKMIILFDYLRFICFIVFIFFFIGLMFSYKVMIKYCFIKKWGDVLDYWICCYKVCLI